MDTDDKRLYGHAYALLNQLAARDRIPDEGLRRALRREDVTRSPHTVEARRLGLLDDEGLTPAGAQELAKGHPGMNGRSVPTPDSGIT